MGGDTVVMRAGSRAVEMAELAVDAWAGEMGGWKAFVGNEDGCVVGWSVVRPVGCELGRH